MTTPPQPAVLADLTARLGTISHYRPATADGADDADDREQRLWEAVLDTARALLAAAEVPDPGQQQPGAVEELPVELADISAGPPSAAWAAGQVAWACQQIIASRTAGLHDELTDLAVQHRTATLAWRLRHAEFDSLSEAWPPARRQIHAWLRQAAPGWAPRGPAEPPPTEQAGR